MKPETILVTSILVILTMTVPRKWILLPFVMAACIIPPDQRIIIFDLDFTTIRFCIFFAVLRLYLFNEIRVIKWNSFDKLFLAWVVCGAIIYIIQQGDLKGVINKSGVLYDSLGLYWLFRMSIRSWNDIHRVVKMFAIFAIISAPFVIFERITQHNLFTYLGSVPSYFHRGRFRCRGPFSHFIMMGLFWASVVPIFASYYVARRSRLFYALSVVCAVICVFLSGSSTPLMALFAIIFFGALWKFRIYGRLIAMSIFGMLFALHVVMDQPVWHLVCRINLFSGSTGWHRFVLFDRFVKYVGEWFLFGTRDVEHWGVYRGDVTNQYVLEAVRGGMLTLVIFLILVIWAVKISGNCSIISKNREHRIFYWGFCISILGHCVSFFGVSYFGQIMLLLYFTFAIVSFFVDAEYGKPAVMYRTAVRFT